MDSNVVALKYNGRSSLDFGAYLTWPTNLVHAKRDLSGISIPGLSGDYISDNRKYTNITQPLQFYVLRPTFYRNWEELEFDFMDWLTQRKSYAEYEPFYLDLLNPYHWLAYLSEAPAWTIQNQTAATVTITLSCKPYLIYGSDEWESVPANIYNDEQIDAHPLFHIVGDGAMTLSINDQDYKLTNVDGEVFIDSTRFLVYKSMTEYRGMNAQFPNNDYPVLKPGNNTVELTGKYNKFEYQPNWRRLA